MLPVLNAEFLKRWINLFELLLTELTDPAFPDTARPFLPRTDKRGGWKEKERRPPNSNAHLGISEERRTYDEAGTAGRLRPNLQSCGGDAFPSRDLQETFSDL